MRCIEGLFLCNRKGQPQGIRIDHRSFTAGGDCTHYCMAVGTQAVSADDHISSFSKDPQPFKVVLANPLSFQPLIDQIGNGLKYRRSDTDDVSPGPECTQSCQVGCPLIRSATDNQHFPPITPVSYTHLTLPTNREV